MQRVQTFFLRIRPLSTMRIFWIFGLQTRFDFRWEWLTLFPKMGRLPHTEQILDMKPYPYCPSYALVCTKNHLIHWNS